MELWKGSFHLIQHCEVFSSRYPSFFPFYLWLEHRNFTLGNVPSWQFLLLSATTAQINALSSSEGRKLKSFPHSKYYLICCLTSFVENRWKFLWMRKNFYDFSIDCYAISINFCFDDEDRKQNLVTNWEIIRRFPWEKKKKRSSQKKSADKGGEKLGKSTFI